MANTDTRHRSGITMNMVRPGSVQFGLVTFLSVICLGASALALAQPDPPPAVLIPDLPVGIRGVSAQDLQTGEVTIGEAADEAATEAWRRNEVQKVWRRWYPERPALSEHEVNLVLEGEMEVEEPAVTFEWSFILRGRPLLGVASTGLLLKGVAGRFYPWCTAILSKPGTVLTARHCIREPHPGETFKVYFPFGGLRDLPGTEISCFCDPNQAGCYSADDLARAALDESYSFLPTAQLGAAGNAVDDQVALIRGFGYASNDSSDFGVLREGEITLAPCSSCDGSTTLTADPAAGRTLCFEFKTLDNAVVNIGDQGNLGFDSGGPMLFKALPANRLIGVSSHMEPDCNAAGTAEGRYVNVTHTAYGTWLNQAFCNPPCLSPSQDIVETLILEPSAQVEADGTTDYEIKVGPWVKQVIITLNHEVGGYQAGLFTDFETVHELDIDLPAELSPDCVEHDGIEVCTLDTPPEADYVLTIRRERGDPNFQLAAVSLHCSNIECWTQHTQPGSPDPEPPGGSVVDD